MLSLKKIYFRIGCTALSRCPVSLTCYSDCRCFIDMQLCVNYPQLFKIMSFHYNADGGKMGPQRGKPSVWSLHVLPMTGRVSSAAPVSSHIPEMCPWGELACPQCPSVSEMCMTVACDGWALHPGWGSSLHPEQQLWAGISRLEKEWPHLFILLS